MDKSSKFLLSVTFAAVVLLAGILAILIDAFTNVPDFREMRGKVVVPIKMANGTWTTREMGPKAKGWSPVSQISNHVLMAVIASEDTSFFSHKGVDYHELQEAIKKDWEEKRWARGASTLTQQVVKNVYLGRQKTLWRKFKEFLWARDIEKVLSKTEILCFYLNMVEWGPDIYGITEAAKHYFDTTPALLTAKQAAFLAVLLPSPIKYHVYFKKKELTPWSRSRVGQVLRVMNRMGFIDEETYQAALKEKLWGVTGVLAPDKEDDNNLPEEDPNQAGDGGKAVDVLKEPVPAKSIITPDEEKKGLEKTEENREAEQLEKGIPSKEESITDTIEPSEVAPLNVEEDPKPVTPNKSTIEPESEEPTVPSNPQ